MKYFILLLFFGLPAMAQEIDFTKDTINLQEIVIGSGKKLKVKTTGLRGPCYAPENMSNASEIVTLVSNLKEGYLHSATFYFNEMLYSKRVGPESLKDTDFELVIYKVNEDNTPGEKIIHDIMVITVKKDHKGSVRADLSGLALENPEKIFIGLKRITRGRQQNEFYIDCLCNGLDKYTTLTRADSATAWKRNWVCAALKVDVAISSK